MQATLELSPIALAVKTMFGEPPAESFDFEYDAYELERRIYQENLKKIKHLSNVAFFTKGLEVSGFVYMNEKTYKYSFLQ